VAHEVMLPPLPLGNIADCVLGQSIYIVGSPYGKINFNAVSRGIISGLGRDWDSTDPYTGKSYGWKVAFTSDSSASPGNSGGPIFTMGGQVIGILVGGYNSTVNCLIPCDLFMNDLDGIRQMFLADRYEHEKASEYDPYSYAIEEEDD
jgi:S1-C subfamily serine protease